MLIFIYFYKGHPEPFWQYILGNVMKTVDHIISIFAALICMALALNAGTVSLTLENDMLGSTDRHYTHGTRLMSTSPDCHKLFEPLFPGKECEIGISLAQYMYTPSDIKIEEKIIGDRPYAGWLYVGLMASMRKDNWSDFIELDLGVTGEESLTEEAQKIVHEWTDSAEPMGWEHQVEGTAGVGLTYIKKHKWKTEWIDLVIRGGGIVGNINMGAGIGTQFRFGHEVPDDFGFLKMEPSSRIFSTWSLYGIVDAECRYAFYSFQFTDSIEEEYQITHEPIVCDLSVGFGAGFDCFSIVYLYNFRSKEFKEQEEHNEFGTVSLVFEY